MFDYENWFSQFPPQIATLLIAMLPIAELRVSLPLALSVFQLSFAEAYFFSVIGNIIPIIFLVWFFEMFYNILTQRFTKAQIFFDWLFKRTRRKFNTSYIKYGQFALIIFVAIPLPLTGAWTGALAGFLFGIPPLRSLILNILGILLAGLIVGFVAQGAFKAFEFIS